MYERTKQFSPTQGTGQSAHSSPRTTEDNSSVVADAEDVTGSPTGKEKSIRRVISSLGKEGGRHASWGSPTRIFEGKELQAKKGTKIRLIQTARLCKQRPEMEKFGFGKSGASGGSQSKRDLRRRIALLRAKA